MKALNSVILTASLLALVFSRAASPTVPMAPEPHPWYVFDVEIEPESLPAGIEWSQADRSLRNRTDIPFYLVRTVDPPMEWKHVLPKDVLPKVKIVGDQTFSYSYLGWKLEPSGKSKRGVVLTHINLISKEDRKRLFSIPRGPGRPAGLPDPVTITIRGYKGSEAVSLKVTIRYKLNEKYRPDRQYFPWYREDFVTIEESPHSDGLAVVKRREFGLPSDLALVNASNTPFYVVEQFETPLTWRDETPDDTLPIYKLASGKAYFAQMIPGLKVNGRKSVRGWIDNSSDSVSLSRWWIEAATTDVEIKDVKADCRPEDAEPPPAQPFIAVTVYGGEKVLIRGQIRYRLNPDYDPVAGQGPSVCASCFGELCAQCAEMERQAKQYRDSLGDFCKRRNGQGL